MIYVKTVKFLLPQHSELMTFWAVYALIFEAEICTIKIFPIMLFKPICIVLVVVVEGSIIADNFISFFNADSGRIAKVIAAAKDSELNESVMRPARKI